MTNELGVNSMSIEKEIEISERRVKRLREQNKSLATSLGQRQKNVMICIDRAGPQDGLGAYQHMCDVERIAKKYNENERKIYDYLDYIRELREQSEAA